MKETHILLVGMILVVLALVSYRVTYALFSDTASSTSNSFAAASVFPTLSPTITPTPTPTPIPEVLINEVFNSNADSLEWVELVNKTSSPLDVSGWKIGEGIAGDDVFPSVTPIPANGYAVIVASGSAVVVASPAIKIELLTGSKGDIGNGGLLASGDVLILRKPDDSVVDRMSYGSNTAGLNPAPTPAPPAGNSVARIPDGTDTNAATDWQNDSTPTLGIINSL